MADRPRTPFADYLAAGRKLVGSASWLSAVAAVTGAALYMLERTGAYIERAGRAPSAASAPSDAGGLPDPGSIAAHHETTRLNVVPLAWLGAGLVLSLAILAAAVWGLQALLGAPPGPPGLRPTALPQYGKAAFEDRFRSRAPGLFPNLQRDLQRFRERQAESAPGYGWVDRDSGIVSMPVERAMERIAERGLPSWKLPGVTGGAAGGAPAGGGGASDGTSSGGTEP